jgi:hypothetical protein
MQIKGRGVQNLPRPFLRLASVFFSKKSVITAACPFQATFPPGFLAFASIEAAIRGRGC